MGTEIMDKAKKRNLGIMSFIPLALLLITLIYQVSTFGKTVAKNGLNDHLAMVEGTKDHFSTLTVMYGITGIATLAVLLYNIVHLLRLKFMPVGSKAVWVVFMAVFMPLAFPFFWYWFIMKEPERLAIKDSIE